MSWFWGVIIVLLMMSSCDEQPAEDPRPRAPESVPRNSNG